MGGKMSERSATLTSATMATKSTKDAQATKAMSPGVIKQGPTPYKPKNKVAGHGQVQKLLDLFAALATGVFVFLFTMVVSVKFVLALAASSLINGMQQLNSDDGKMKVTEEVGKQEEQKPGKIVTHRIEADDKSSVKAKAKAEETVRKTTKSINAVQKKRKRKSKMVAKTDSLKTPETTVPEPMAKHQDIIGATQAIKEDNGNEETAWIPVKSKAELRAERAERAARKQAETAAANAAVAALSRARKPIIPLVIIGEVESEKGSDNAEDNRDSDSATGEDDGSNESSHADTNHSGKSSELDNAEGAEDVEGAEEELEDFTEDDPDISQIESIEDKYWMSDAAEECKERKRSGSAPAKLLTPIPELPVVDEPAPPPSTVITPTEENRAWSPKDGESWADDTGDEDELEAWAAD